MSELNYIGPDELVFNNDVEKGIHSGGFCVKSIMMKSNMSPIMTLNSPDSMIGGNKVSDLFNDLVVPNWVLSYNNRIVGGGKYKEVNHDDDTESDDEVIHDDLHEKLLDLVKQHNAMSKPTKKRLTKKLKKSITKKGGTKKRI
jgi:hypothetical protein